MKFPFYEKARALWTKTQDKQIAKGLEKYPEPFNPDSWTADELLDHALEESVDLVHYLVGLKDKLDKLEKENQELKQRLHEAGKLRKLLATSAIPKPSPFEEQLRELEVAVKNAEVNFYKGYKPITDDPLARPPYADLDD